MKVDKNSSDITIQKVLYFGISASIIFLNVIVIFITGLYSPKIPDDELDTLLFTCGGVLLLCSLVIPIFLSKKSNDYQTIQLVTWACLEGVVTIGFIHSYMAQENFMLFYTVPVIFQMFKSYPRKN